MSDPTTPLKKFKAYRTVYGPNRTVKQELSECYLAADVDPLLARMEKLENDKLNGCAALKEALEDILDALEERYDGAPDSPTRWMSPYIEQAKQAMRAA